MPPSFRDILRELKDYPERLESELRLAVKKGSRDLQREARQKHDFKTRTGALERSVQFVFDQKKIRSDLFLNTAVAKYAAAVHDGSKPHIIQPNQRKALRFVKNSNFIFAKMVRHPGYKGDPFLFDAFDKKGGLIAEQIAKSATKLEVFKNG